MIRSPLADRLDAGEVLILDGATGTELERRGVPMSEAAWCGLASLEHGDVLSDVHHDYIEVGADIITANTFASSRLMLGLAGAEDRVPEVVRAAVDAAKRARDRSGREVVIAGSLSHMMPVQPGTDVVHDDLPDDTALREACEELAGALADAGVDLILLEMMYQPERMVCAIDAALATGLPVWCGTSARLSADGRPLSFSRRSEIPYEKVAAVLPTDRLEVVGVMHSDVRATGAALKCLEGTGHLMAYPDSGYFAMPSWQFQNIIEPDRLVEHARDWLARRVSVLGGCCGLGIEHIRALAELRSLG